MSEKKSAEQYVLLPDIKQYGEFQVFEFHGKDARGYDFGVRLTPTQAIPLMDEPAQAAEADRVFMYAGGDPATIGEIDTEIEVTLGEEQEGYSIDKAAMTYIPKGMVHRQCVTGDTEKTAWVLMLTLPPEYIPPEKPAE